MSRNLMGVEFSTPLLARAPLGSRPGEWWRVQNPLPEDATFLWCFMRVDRRSVVFVFSHGSFGEVPEGAPIPTADLFYESIVVPEGSR